MGVFRLAFLDNEKRVQTQRSRRGRSARCSSASRSRSAGRRASARSWRHPRDRGIEELRAAKASLLLAVYSLGLGVPFLLTSLAIDQFFAARQRSAATTTPSSWLGRAARRHRRADLHRPADGDLRYLQPYLPTF